MASWVWLETNLFISHRSRAIRRGRCTSRKWPRLGSSLKTSSLSISKNRASYLGSILARQLSRTSGRTPSPRPSKWLRKISFGVTIVREWPLETLSFRTLMFGPVFQITRPNKTTDFTRSSTLVRPRWWSARSTTSHSSRRLWRLPPTWQVGPSKMASFSHHARATTPHFSSCSARSGSKSTAKTTCSRYLMMANSVSSSFCQPICLWTS